jgi:hypothetical protein
MLSLVRAVLPMVERRLESGTLVHSAHVHEESLAGGAEEDDAHDGVSTSDDGRADHVEHEPSVARA